MKIDNNTPIDQIWPAVVNAESKDKSTVCELALKALENKDPKDPEVSSLRERITKIQKDIKEVSQYGESFKKIEGKMYLDD